MHFAFLLLHNRLQTHWILPKDDILVPSGPGFLGYDGFLVNQVLLPHQSKSSVDLRPRVFICWSHVRLSLQEKTEWLVVPIIVVFAFVVGLLNAVFLGLAMSTFIFVASFFRSGVVKYIANGLSVRSTIERPPNAADWLDQNGELIQVLVLQNYLFFGNASSILAYISSMFEDPDPDVDPIFVPPIPKVLVLDLTLVTGMDTSSVDVFADIVTLCSTYNCKVFLGGPTRVLIETMSLSGLKPDTAAVRSTRKLRFFSDLDKAVGKAEDMLLQQEGFEEHITHAAMHGKRGFEHA